MEKDDNLQVSVRSKEGVYILESQLEQDQNLKGKKTISKDNGNMIYSKDGSKLVIIGTNGVQMMDSIGQIKLDCVMTFNEVIMDSELSEGGKYLNVMLRVNKDQYDLCILSLQDQLREVKRWSYNKYIRESWCLVKYNQDDSHMVRIMESNSQIELNRMGHIIQTIQKIDQYLDHVRLFDYNQNIQIVCGLEQHDIGFNQTKAELKIYQYQPGKDSVKPILQKQMIKAQKIEVKASSDNEILLIKAIKHVDDSNLSYYGTDSLFHYSFQHNKWKQIELFDGPVHAYEFVTKEDKILIISGFMPAFCILYSKYGNPIYKLYQNHRNTIVKPDKWSNHLVLVAGFGNLNGNIDIWDLKDMKCINSQCKSPSATQCFWSPCHNYFITAILNPRLRVNNQYNVFNKKGIKLHTLNMNHTEMYQVIYQPKIVYSLSQIENPKKEEDQSIQQQSEQPQQKFFRPKGGSNFANLLKADKQQTDQANKITQDEYQQLIRDNKQQEVVQYQQQQPIFSLKQNPIVNQNHSQNNIPGQVVEEVKQKKKRIRKKKELQEQE